MDLMPIGMNLGKQLLWLIWQAMRRAAHALVQENSTFVENPVIPAPAATQTLTTSAFAAHQTGKVRVEADGTVVSTNGGAAAPDVQVNYQLIRDIGGIPVVLAGGTFNTGGNAAVAAGGVALEIQDTIPFGAVVAPHTYSLQFTAVGAGNVITYTNADAAHINVYEMP